MPAYLSGFCRRLGKNKRIQRWLDRLRRAPAHVELTVPLMTTWRYLTGRPPKSLSCVQAVTKCPILSSVCSTEKPGHVIRSGAGSKGRTRECNDGCTGLSRAPAHVELTVPLVDDWSTSGAPRVILLFGLRMSSALRLSTGPFGAHGTSGGLVMSLVEIPQN